MKIRFHDKNYPKDYASFHALVDSGHKQSQMGFHVSTDEVYRFTNRFRVAKAFLGIKLDNYTPNTVIGYDSLFKVFLAYSAFELFLKIIGKKQYTVMGMLTPYKPANHIAVVLQKDKGKQFYTFVHHYLDNPNHKKNLKDVYDGNSQNITYIASSIRHIFAHGHLSAHANNCNPLTVKEVCNNVFDFHMKVMDDEFSKVVCTYKSTI